jgi:MFS-type transporter involved in bile tolerance (Atg22 family)
MSTNFKFAMLFPILSIICIAAFAGSLGVIFMVLDETAVGENGVIILGSVLVIFVPLIAFLLERNTEQG